MNPMSDRRDISVSMEHKGSANFFAVKQHFLIHVYGTVQGVGYRPFVHRLAHALGVNGTVANNGEGVVIHAEAGEHDLGQFMNALREDAPAAARISRIETRVLPLVNFPSFRIRESEAGAEIITEISADLALCKDCRAEVLNTADRRHCYPFINCTNCGPRFTIIRGLPYDRPLTTMVGFEMCPECRDEYENPLDRRFHAQPIACSVCGPKLALLSNSGGQWQESQASDVLEQAAERIRRGEILLVQGIGGFHLAANARNDTAVRELRRRKGREEKPFAVMFPSLEKLEEWCDVSGAERAALTSYRAPIVLVRKQAACPVAESVAPGNPFLGCLLPYSPLHVLLMNAVRDPLVMTSANPSDEPMVYRVEDALGQMAAIADAALVHDRPIHVFADDSVVKVISDAVRVWRRARGYVPEPVRVPEPFGVPVLAFGGQLKNAFCIGRGTSGILSQHLGDLESEHGAEEQRRTLEHFLKLYAVRIERAVCDLHPDYVSTRLAEEWSERNCVPLIRVQHHHAHMAACMAENGVTEKVIGLCLDGTGYGTDGTIWGGEVLVGDFHGFERLAHLENIPMPGGELAARQPWRMALAWLHCAYGERLFELPLPLLEALRRQYSVGEIHSLLHPNLMRGVYPLTSSAGRLFDAVSALLGFGMREQYEGQAAMELEWKIANDGSLGYNCEILHGNDGYVLSPIPLFRELVKDVQDGVPQGIISRRFHEGLARAFAGACTQIGEDRALQTVALSGGCFQNSFLLRRFEELLTTAGFRVLSHRDVPTNDGGIALGQACIANAQEI
jgi:hydrogenase maturation protein HypF